MRTQKPPRSVTLSCGTVIPLSGRVSARVSPVLDLALELYRIKPGPGRAARRRTDLIHDILAEKLGQRRLDQAGILLRKAARPHRAKPAARP